MRLMQQLQVSLGDGGGGSTPIPAQTVYPDSDITPGGWITAPLWSNVDDQSITDFISISSGDTALVMGTVDAADPGINTGHVFKVYAQNLIGLTTPEFSVYQGVTKIEGFTPTLVAGTPTIFSLNMNATNVANITDYTALRFVVEAGLSIAKSDAVTIYGWWLELPSNP